MPSADLSVSRRLLTHLDAAPTPYHAVQRAAELLDAAGFEAVADDSSIPRGAGRGYVRRGGALVGWAVADHHGPATGLRIVGAHTDSPNLRLKPAADVASGPWRQLGVEVYGGALLNSWLDRDLGLAGRAVLRDGDRTRTALFRDDRPLLRVPQLAIHLDADIREKGLLLNKQRHMVPVWGLGDGPTFAQHLAERLEVEPHDVLSWDAMAHDLTPATLAGRTEEFLVSARIDNLLSCFLAVEALAAAPTGPHLAVVCLFDHEEVGSVSATGAASPLLGSIVDRLGHALGGDLDDRHRARADSIMLSADGAHGTHPNYADRHEPDHQIELNAGPVLKINSNLRYATDAQTAAAFTLACEQAGVPMQRFVNRTDLACGSTIGPISAGALGIPVVDAGCAQLAMHSAREMAGSQDPAWFRSAMEAFLSA